MIELLGHTEMSWTPTGHPQRLMADLCGLSLEAPHTPHEMSRALDLAHDLALDLAHDLAHDLGPSSAAHLSLPGPGI